MKRLITLILALLVTGIMASCTDSSVGPQHGNIYGTWRIDNPTHATWLGSSAPQMAYARTNTVAAKVGIQDTLYITDNKSFNIQIVVPGEYGADFQFKFTDYRINGLWISNNDMNIIEISNLGSNFKVENWAGTRGYGNRVNWGINFNFKCEGISQNTGDLMLRFESVYRKYPQTQPNNYDTTAVTTYHVETNGLYQTVNQLVCSN